MARKIEGRVGIGIGKRTEVIEDSIRGAQELGIGDIDVYSHGSELCMDLREGKLCAAVRGTLSSTEMIASIRDIFNQPSILRVALLATATGKPFFLAPVGIDEGNTIEERYDLLSQGVRFIRCMGVEPSIAILSKGREDDDVRGEEISRSLEEGEILTQKARGLNLVAEHKHILLEQAAREFDFVIAPDGVTGNLIFRSLYFLGGGGAVGAPIVNLERVFVDTSRDKRSYQDSIALAAALCVAMDLCDDG